MNCSSTILPFKVKHLQLLHTYLSFSIGQLKLSKLFQSWKLSLSTWNPPPKKYNSNKKNIKFIKCLSISEDIFLLILDFRSETLTWEKGKKMRTSSIKMSYAVLYFLFFLFIFNQIFALNPIISSFSAKIWLKIRKKKKKGKELRSSFWLKLQ